MHVVYFVIRCFLCIFVLIDYFYFLSLVNLNTKKTKHKVNFYVEDRMSIFRNILLVKVGIVILLHALVPHGHHGEMIGGNEKQVHEDANSFIKVLSLGFHNKLSNDFDNYKLSKEVSLKKNSFFCIVPYINSPSSFENIEIHSKLENREWLIFQTKLFNTFNSLSNRLRGPPTHDFYA